MANPRVLTPCSCQRQATPFAEAGIVIDDINGMIDGHFLTTQIRSPARDKEVADFLYWSRLPFAEVARRPGEARVTIGDARYNRAPDGRFSVRAVVPE